jgi:hypothetical protein
MQLGTRSSTHLIHPVRQRRLWPRPSSSHASRIHEIVTPLSTGYTCPVTIRASLPRRARGTSSYAESQVRNRLSAGGRWIRTIGPWHEGAGFCCGRRITETNGAAKRVVSYAVPMVRIQSLQSQQRTRPHQRAGQGKTRLARGPSKARLLAHSLYRLRCGRESRRHLSHKGLSYSLVELGSRCPAAFCTSSSCDDFR